MATRTVTGIIRHLDGTAWVNGAVLFSLASGSYDVTAQYPRDKKVITTDANGSFSVDLWVNADGLTPSKYTCILPSGEYILFVLPNGSGSIDIGTLRASSSIDPNSTEYYSILAYIDAAINTHNQDLTAHSNLISGGQVLDPDLAAIASLSTQSFGRNLLTLSSESEVRNTIGKPKLNQSFTQASLTVGNILVINHGFGQYPNSVKILDNFGEEIIPDSIQNTSINSISINLSSFVLLTGTWNVNLGI